MRELAGYGATCDAWHATMASPDGEGAARAMRDALVMARLDPADVDYVNAHGTATQPNDRLETLAIKHVFGARASNT